MVAGWLCVLCLLAWAGDGSGGAPTPEALASDAELALELAVLPAGEFDRLLADNALGMAEERRPGLVHGDETGSNASCHSYLVPVGKDAPVSAPDELLRFGAHVTLETTTTTTAGAGGASPASERAVLMQTGGGAGRTNRHAAQGGAPSDVPLGCECASWSCHCNKDCFCKMRGETFGGERLGPKSAMNGIADVSPDFQCTCDASEVGGPNPSGGGSIDCDCSEAQCRCERRCACSPKP